MTDYYEYLRKAAEYYGYFPTKEEYVWWAKNNNAPSYSKMYLEIGSFREAAKILGVPMAPRKKHKPRELRTYSNLVTLTTDKFEKVKRKYISRSEISQQFNVPAATITVLDREGFLPQPAIKVEDGGVYWYKPDIEKFFKNYNPSLTKELVNTKRRKDILERTREIVKKYNIKTAREYLKIALRKREVADRIVDPATLWKYSITFEEILGVEKITDEISRDIINLLENEMTAQELALALKVSKRTIIRKIKKLKEAGLNIERNGRKYYLK